MEKLRPEDT